MNSFNKFGAGVIGVMTLVSIASPVFAMEKGDLSSSGDKKAINHSEGKLQNKAFDATKVNCVGTAVADREDSIDAAFSAFAASESAALTARKTDLASAYANSTDNSSLKTAVKTAWKTFKTAKAAARKTFWEARLKSWETFKTAAKACGASPVDGPDMSNEINK